MSPNEGIFSRERSTIQKQTTKKQTNKHIALFDMFVEFIQLINT